MSATLIYGDCLEKMKELPDKSVDCFICDLPYGCLTGGAGKEKAKRMEKTDQGTLGHCNWDVKIDLVKFWKEIKRWYWAAPNLFEITLAWMAAR